MKPKLLLAPLFLCFAMSSIVMSESPGQAVIPFDTPDPTAVEAPDGKGLYVFSTGRGIQI
jgi:hypothetical protein